MAIDADINGTRFLCSYDRNNRISQVTVSLKQGGKEWIGKISLLEPHGKTSQNLICAGRGCLEERAVPVEGIVIGDSVIREQMINTDLAYCERSCTLYPYYEN